MVLEKISFVETVGFDIVCSDLGRDIESSLKDSLSDGVIFNEGSSPLVIFRKILTSSIVDIEAHPRGRLFQKFLAKGPYEKSGKIPKKFIDKRLSDSETAAAITFIYAHMVNCFKGAITELLAVKPCMHLMKRLQTNGQLPYDVRLYIGDSVKNYRQTGKGLLKGADQYLLIQHKDPCDRSCISVAGVTEVKSYFLSQKKLWAQVDRHLLRSKQGLKVNDENYPEKMIRVGYGSDRKIFRMAVFPSRWKLPRIFEYIKTEDGHMLHVEPGKPNPEDKIIQTGEHDWRITLKWSKEALAQAAYDMTFWYMAKVGEVIYSESIPKGWGKMTPAEAGQNSVKMMLYFSILRCNTPREKQRAIALYNSYCFGYALGMNFKDAKGRREMLWPKDLDEILETGKTKQGCTLQ